MAPPASDKSPADHDLRFAPLLEAVRPILARQRIPVYLVGGAVRDALLGLPSRDLDFAAPEGAVQLTFAVADALRLPAYVLDEERDVGRVVVAGEEATIDIARYRGADLAADLYGRDFTINALALPVTDLTSAGLIDLFGGKGDLEARRLRLIHNRSVADDPVRALRAVRLRRQFDLTMTPETAAAVREAAGLLRRVSPERVRDEFVKLLQQERPDRAIAEMGEANLLAVVLPDLAALAEVEQSPPHFEVVLAHTLRVLRYLAQIEALLDGQAPTAPWQVTVSQILSPHRASLRDHLARVVDGGLNGRLLLRLGALWHDAGKKPTQTIEPDGRIRFLGHAEAGAELAGRWMRRFAFSQEAARLVRAIVAGHMRPLLLATEGRPPSRRAVYRFFRDAGPAGLDIVLLAMADHLATYDGPGDNGDAWPQLLAVVDRLFESYFVAHREIVRPPRLLSGKEVIADLGLAEGPEIGRLLRLLEEAQAAGEVATREEALSFVRRHAQT